MRRLLRAWIGRGAASALSGPGLEIFDRIDDATAELAEHRTRAGAAMLLERPAGETEKGGRVVRANETRSNA